MMENKPLLENEILHNENPYHLEPWKVDKYIEIVKENNKEIEKYEQILKGRIEELKRQFEEKKEKLLEENRYLLNTLKQFALQQEDLKETKTQYKWSSLNGEIVVKKSLPKTKKPSEEKIDEIEKRYPELVSIEKRKKLNWRTLKDKIVVENGVPYDKETGESLEGIVEVEYSPEEVQIK